MKRRDFAMGLGSISLGAAIVGGPALAKAMDITWTSPSKRDLSKLDKAWESAASGATPALGQTDALLILQDGGLVYERYGPDHGPDTRHIAWSMTKSITHALTGIAVGEGKVDIDRPLLTPHAGDPKLTLRHLITLTDGLDWDEGDYDPAKSDATKMLFGPGRFDGAAYVAAKTQAVPPGTRWRYSTGAFHLAAAELQANLFPEARTPDTRRAAMASWMDSRLFTPVGMTSVVPEFDAAGTFVGGSLLYATARDFARFGEFYRNDGVWLGRRVLPVGWVAFGRKPTLQPAYGAGWWLEAEPGQGEASLMRGAGPMDAYSAQGHNGQVIAVIPSKNAVVVRLGLMDDGDAGWAALATWLTPVVNGLPDRKSHPIG
jgi:CubicO group peptidase (beta-lactamase class C family)